MDKVCIVPGCENKSTDCPSDGGAISFYPFPSEDEDLYQLWIHQIGLTSPPPKSAVVCSAHFDDDSFYIEWTLNDDAIPSIRVGEGDELQICTYCASEADAEKFRTGVYTKVNAGGPCATCALSGKSFEGNKEKMNIIQNTQEAGVQSCMSTDGGTPSGKVKLIRK